MFGRNPTAAEVLSALGGVGSLLDGMRRQAEANRQSQENIRNARRHSDDMQARANAAEVQSLLECIHGANARFFKTVIITDAEWTPICPTSP